jgi:pyruvate formate lyase activating enzyme
MDKTQHSPLILDIKGNSLDDGPGIRSVIFFKGCPLSCVWCHNPESKKAGPEISFDANECVACDTCIKTCPKDALSRENPFFIDRERCNLCFLCVDNCPSGALSRVGKELSIDAIMSKVRNDIPFFKTSGGGVTLSGGEPTLFMDFLSELLQGLKAEGINVLLETCGLFKLDAFIEKILPHLDIIYYDIKLIDPKQHKQYCGVSNETILENFKQLNKMSTQGGFNIFPRTPLIPGITATTENLTGIADFLHSQSIHKTQLMAYNPLWFEKNQNIGAVCPMEKDADKSTWITQEKIMEYKAFYKGYGIEV